MPELPDVEIFKRLVEHTCLGKLIVKADAVDPGSLEGASPATLQRRLKGRSLRACRRHGKVLLFETDSAAALAMHFGTNGSLRYLRHEDQEPGSVRLLVDFADGGRLAYLNPRRIGHVHVVSDVAAFIAESQLGADALDPGFDLNVLARILHGRKQAIKSVLMDQTRVAGIGNIYADEILFHARLHPAIAASTLDRQTMHRLFDAIKSVLRTAIDCGAGAENFTDRLPEGFLLPQRHEGGHCPRCGTPIEQVRRGGRAGYVCPRCQPAPDA